MDWPYIYWALTVSGIVYGLTAWPGNHLPDSVQGPVVRWLTCNAEDLWARRFTQVFDKVFGPVHLSPRRIVGSAIASGIAIVILWALFDPVLGLMGSRADIAMPVWQVLLVGLAVNLLADYLSLWETRWLLGRFETIRALPAQAVLLLADLAFSATIILVAIAAFRLLQGERLLSPVELLAAYTPYAIFSTRPF